MKTLLDPVIEMGMRFRVNQLRPTATARWGKTSAPRVLTHLVDAFAIPLGEAPATPKNRVLAFHPLLWLFVHVVPCPDSSRLVTDEIPEPEGPAWKAQLQTWQDACGRFVARGRSRTDPTLGSHPVFGALSTDEWGRLVYLHTDHHLRQFGV